VKGTVIQVTASEITLNLGYKSDGIIVKNEYSHNPNVDLMAEVNLGDVLEVCVTRVNDGEGNVLVSKRKLDAQTNYKLIEKAFQEKEVVVGRVQDLVKGGLIAIVYGNRVFVPSSQISNRFVEDLSVFKGKELNFNILEFDRSKRRIVAGRKELASLEQKQRREELYATLEVGQRIEGTVSRITDFGAFIDLGGVDGLVHISELAWRRVRKVSDVLSVGQSVVVTVIAVDPEKNKISLTLKDINNNPWNNIADKYPIGSFVEGKVVRMAGFGAFVNLEDGVDGLVHISQIAAHHIAKPEDELEIGQTITVQVTDVDEENKKISLSKRKADARYDDEYDDDDYYDDDEYDDDYDDVREEDGVEEDPPAVEDEKPESE
jgi:4-hydroxy-3-methylbut-2-enyl diphosphate reductase